MSNNHSGNRCLQGKMIFNRGRILRSFTMLICMVMLAVFVLPSARILATAASRPTRTIRVGWFDSQFCKTDQYGRRSGYAYEYLQDIAAQTGWQYEYVEDSWPNLLQLLEWGDIDLLADVTYTDERSKKILYSETPMGDEQYYLYAAYDNDEVDPTNPRNINGHTVAIYKDSIQLQYFETWAARLGAQPIIVEVTESEDELLNLLNAGAYDALVSVHQDAVPITQVGGSDVYFGISKEKPVVKAELDKAMRNIKATQQGYESYLHRKYMDETPGYERLLSNEMGYLKVHDTIRVGYARDLMAFSGEDSEGQLTGVLKDYLENMQTCFRNAELSFETVGYDLQEDALKDLQDGVIDAVFPVTRGPYEAEQENILVTKGTLTTEVYAVIRKASASTFLLKNPNQVVLEEHDHNYRSFLMDQFPDWQIVDAADQQARIHAVQNDQADLFLTTAYRVNEQESDFEQHGLLSVSTGKQIEFSFAVRRDNLALHSIFNRATNLITEDQIDAALARYAIAGRKVGFREIVRDNAGMILSIGMLVLMVFFVLLILMMISKSKADMLVEELAEARDDAEAASRAKSTFLFNMSHDIRTPMNAIIGFTNLLEKNLDNKEQAVDYIRKIQNSNNFLLSLVNNVLEMARIESGKEKLDESFLNSRVLYESVINVFESQMEQKHISFKTEFDVQHTHIYADETKIREVFLNLLSNAVKYTPEGGEISLKIKELPGEQEDSVMYECVVADTGIGMSETYLPQIFDSFSRAHNTTESGIGGTGLGMAIVKRLVDLMNGTIEVESKLDEGSTFTVRLNHRILQKDARPESASACGCELAVPAEQEGGTFVMNAESLRGLHILLAEDNELNAEIAMELLIDAGFTVAHATDGVACINMLSTAEEGTYDLILMDIQMPKMDGYKTTESIRRFANPKLARIPIIAMTANAFEEDRKRAIDAGMDDYVTKPFKMDVLLCTIAQAMRFRK